jgi:mono/diheme cytochrome c family protein
MQRLRPMPPRRDDIADFEVDAVETVLAANCSPCHGPALGSAGSGGISFIDGDLEPGSSRAVDQLVEAGLIVPMSSATSRIIIVMEDGSMPPRSSGLPPVTQADIDTVRGYIDNPRYWPGAAAPSVVDAGLAAPTVDAGSDGG